MLYSNAIPSRYKLHYYNIINYYHIMALGMFGLGNIEAVALESARFKRTAVVTMTGEEEDNIIRVRSSMGVT